MEAAAKIQDRGVGWIGLLDRPKSVEALREKCRNSWRLTHFDEIFGILVEFYIV